MLYPYDEGKSIAVIPARSGSKRVEHKNIQSIGGTPLLVRSIYHAKEAELKEVWVTTDSPLYGKIAEEHGAKVHIRPEAVSQDLTTDAETFLFFLDFYKEKHWLLPEYIVHLRPTAPIRRPGDIQAMLKRLKDEGADSIRSVSPSKENPYKTWHLVDGVLVPLFESVMLSETWGVNGHLNQPYNLPGQLLPKTYHQNANIDIVRTEVLLRTKSMTGFRTLGYVQEDLPDVDTYGDLAEVVQDSDPLSSSSKRFCVDMDGVICSLTTRDGYRDAVPLRDNIRLINWLYDTGHVMNIYTARGFDSGIDWYEVTIDQLSEWEVHYDNVFVGKPAADYYIDDRGLTMEQLRRMIREKKGEKA